MIFPDQIDKLVTKLSELTAKDKVEWKETGSAYLILRPSINLSSRSIKAAQKCLGASAFKF